MLIQPTQKLVKLVDGANDSLTFYCELPREWLEEGETTITKAWLTVKSDATLADNAAEIFVTVVGPWVAPDYPRIKPWGRGAKIVVDLPAATLIPGFYYHLSLKYLTGGNRTRSGFEGFLVSETGGVKTSS
jgi:hypothetical protein